MAAHPLETRMSSHYVAVACRIVHAGIRRCSALQYAGSTASASLPPSKTFLEGHVIIDDMFRDSGPTCKSSFGGEAQPRQRHAERGSPMHASQRRVKFVFPNQ